MCGCVVEDKTAATVRCIMPKHSAHTQRLDLEAARSRDGWTQNVLKTKGQEIPHKRRRTPGRQGQE